MKPIALDFETPYGKDFSVVDLGYDRYARDARCIPYLVAVSDGSENWAGRPSEFNFESLRGRELVSHNSAFDEEISLGAAERGLFTVPGLSRDGMSHWHCTLNMSSYLWNVRSLKDAASIGLGIDISKGVRDRAKDKTPEDMVAEGWWGDMVKYGMEDAQNCWNLWDRHSHKFPTMERQLSRLTIDQGRHGIRIDAEALEVAVKLLERVIFAAGQNLPWVARGRAPASPIGIAEECKLNGIPPPPVKARDPEAAQDWEDEYAPRFKFVHALKNLRKAKKTLSTLQTIQLRIRADGTVAFSLKYAGASTLRWAGDSGWNLQNMNKEPLFFDMEYSFIFDKAATRPLCEEFDKEHAGHRSVGALKNGTKFFDFRGLVMAREGMVLGPVDLAQIEPRVLNYLAGNHELLALVRQGMAIYEAHARSTMGWTAGDLKTMNKMLYALAKARVLGLGYGCGWEKFILLAAIYGVDITEGDQDFAVEASVDKAVHRRVQFERVRPSRKTGLPVIVREWHYTSLPAGMAYTAKFPQALASEAADGEDCVFVEVYRERRGAVEKVLKALPVYGMRSRVTVDEFRKSNPLIMGLHERLQTNLENSVGGDLVLEGPHGGTLTYRDIRVERRLKKDKETGEEYEKSVYTGIVGTKRVILYGGLLCENLIQWISRMVFAERMLELDARIRAKDPRQRVLFSVHDEAVPELLDPGADTGPVKKRLEQIMSITPSWLGDCPLGAEAKIVRRYLK